MLNKPFLSFLERQLQSFKVVFFVLGMEEHFLISLVEAKRLLNRLSLTTSRKAKKDPEKPQGKFIFLDDTRYDMPDEKITILGSSLSDPLWLGRGPQFPTRHQSYSYLLNEVKAIKDQDPSRAVIILTHLYPDRERRGNDLTLGPLESSNVKLWAFGNSQHNFDYEEMPGKRVYCNQRGRSLHRFRDFDVGRVVDVKPSREVRLPAQGVISPWKNAWKNARPDNPQHYKRPNLNPYPRHPSDGPKKDIEKDIEKGIENKE